MKDKLVLKRLYTSKTILNKYKNNSIDTVIIKDYLYYGRKYIKKLK